MNMEKLCRLCLKKLPEWGSVSVFGKNTAGEMISEIILACTSILVQQDDKQPNNICADCLKTLLSCHAFRGKCLKANNLLTTYLMDTKCENEKVSLVAAKTLETECSTNPDFNVLLVPKEIEESECSVDEVDVAKDVSIMREMALSENKKIVYIKRKKFQRKSLEEFRETAKLSLNKEKSRPKIKASQPAHRVKPASFPCKFCDKIYPSEGGWRYHVHTMHSQSYQPFLCDLCGKAFKAKKNLEVHKSLVHLKLREHLCDLCGQKFGTKYGLRVHQVWHSGEKKYECHVCKTKFASNGKLNTHLIVHEGFKKFMCEVCSRVFRWKKDFAVHMRTHTGEKPFVCKICNKAFASVTNKRKHESSHSKNVQPLPNDGVFIQDNSSAAT